MTHSRKRIRKLSTAVFRGSRTEYSFDVYPITTAITDNPAIFIFSRRSVDKFGRAHHAVSCVGETGSIVAEIKKHKRAICFKGRQANVVCILKEPNMSARTGVLEDIAAARNFACVGGKLKPTIKAKSTNTAKILPFKPPSRAGVNIPCDSGGKSDKRTRKRSKDEQLVGSRHFAVKSAKKGKAPKSEKRVSDDIGNDERKHRIPKLKKRPVARTIKTKIAFGSLTSKKLAA